jgi:hypothetical protein
MISNSGLQITLLSFLFKKFNIIKKGINIKDTLKLYAACLVVSYTQRPSGFKAIIKSIFKTNLPSLTSAPFFLPILSQFLSERAFEIYKILQKCE